MDVKNELREIRIQMASDFDFTALALKDMGQRFRAGMTDTARSLEAMGLPGSGQEKRERKPGALFTKRSRRKHALSLSRLPV